MSSVTAAVADTQIVDTKGLRCYQYEGRMRTWIPIHGCSLVLLFSAVVFVPRRLFYGILGMPSLNRASYTTRCECTDAWSLMHMFCSSATSVHCRIVRSKSSKLK